MKKLISFISSTIILISVYGQNPIYTESTITITTGYNNGFITNGQTDPNWTAYYPYSLASYPQLPGSSSFVVEESPIANWPSLNVDPDSDGDFQYLKSLLVNYPTVPGNGSSVVYRTEFNLDNACEVSLNLKLVSSHLLSIRLNGIFIGSGDCFQEVAGGTFTITDNDLQHFNLNGTNTIDIILFSLDGSNCNPLQQKFALSAQANVEVKFDCYDKHCSSLALDDSTDYWISAWVNVDTIHVKNYNTKTTDAENAHLEVDFLGQTIVPPLKLYPTGDIIDGWQRIVGKFDIPVNTTNIKVGLNSDKYNDTYFDDIRLHPFNASMKSYVYDGETFWLTSELDDNNYATFYEYDNEGGLVRIKKETSRGVVTIQETRSNTVKKD